MTEQVLEKDEILKLVNEERLVELAKEMIKIPSQVEEETELAKFLQKYMQEHGLETEMMEVEDGRMQPIGRIRGTGEGYSLIFNGHMDTDVVPLGVKDPLVPRIEGRRLYGHGIMNMKSGVAAMVEAAVAVKQSGVKLKGDLIVTPVVGETQGGVGTVTLIKRGIRADMGLDPEPYQECLSTTHAGVMDVAITIKGRCEHINAMERGINASYKMAKVIDALTKMKFTYTPDPRLPLLPRMMVGSAICGHGDTYDLSGATFVPDHCTMIVNIRYLPGMHPDEDIARVLEKIKSEDPEFEYEMRVTPDDPELPGMPWRNHRVNLPPRDLSTDEPIVKTCAQNFRYVTGEEPVVGAIPVDHPFHHLTIPGDDAAHLTKAGIPSLSCGPKGWHVDGLQYVEIDSMLRVAKVMAATAYDICTKERE